MTTEYKASRTLSKKKYEEFVQTLNTLLSDETTITLVTNTLKEVLKFDPNVNTYLNLKETLKDKLDQGMSTYQATNQRKYYLAHKEELNKKRQQLRKKTI